MKIPSFLYALKPLSQEQRDMFAHPALYCIKGEDIGRLKLLAKQGKAQIVKKETRYSIAENTDYVHFEPGKSITDEEEDFVLASNSRIREQVQQHALAQIPDRQKAFLEVFNTIYGFSEIKKALLLQYFNPGFSIALLCQDRDVYNNFIHVLSMMDVIIADKWNKAVEEKMKEDPDAPGVFIGLLKQSISKELVKYANSGLDDYFDIIFVLEKYKKEDFENIAQLVLEKNKKALNKEDFKLLKFAKDIKGQTKEENLFGDKKHLSTIKSFVCEMKSNEDKYYFNVSVDIINTIKQLLIAQLAINNSDKITDREIWNAIEIVSFSNFKRL
ncbi:MAG: hypothetical protein DRN66_01940 [Candidatus Nanohalarchaeota archaeon]|nr:MAG: hypothetical protein DRN66_01940 [Candidatus Nanohaloarchaeota archaeon]